MQKALDILNKEISALGVITNSNGEEISHMQIDEIDVITIFYAGN